LDDIEQLILWVTGFGAIFAWFRWYAPLLSISPLYSSRTSRLPLLLLPVFGAMLLFGVLRTLASFDVRDDPTYLGLYMVIGLFWIPLGLWCFRVFGLSAREDAVERRNPAALYALSGALVAMTVCYAGGNIGNGPGWWAVFHSAGLASGTLLLLMAALNMLVRIFDSVTIERDVSAGLRLAGLLIGLGLILGRAAAGDWYSFEQMNRVFVNQAWVVVILMAFALVIEFVLRPTAEHPNRPALMAGVIPGVFYVVVATALIAWEVGWTVYRG